MECQACFRRYLGALAATHRPTFNPRLSRRSITMKTPMGARRMNGSYQHHSSQRDSSPEPPPPTTPQPTSKESRENALKRPTWRKISPETHDLVKPTADPDAKFTRNLITELKYLRDPLKLANYVRYILQRGEELKALAIVRLASKSMANTVSWNHIIDWQLRQGKISPAMDTYNELKKRGQHPDSYTYLLLLRGLANHAHNPSALGKALSLYHSMWAPRNKVAPSIIHTNAVLKVCARANDIDSLWDIASRLPQTGAHAADALTFTTILNNLRMNVLDTPVFNDTSEENARRRQKAVTEGRKLWVIITQRWRDGDLSVDEELVCSMGRLLLVGNTPRDSDDILSLIHQTMNIPRQIPRLGTPSRPNSLVSRIHAPDVLASENEEKDEPALTGDVEESHAGNEFEPFTTSASKATDSVISKPGGKGPHVRRLGKVFAYTKPGNSTLSVIMECCLKMKEKKLAGEYWEILTSPETHRVVPDLDNAHMYLRVLRQSRASGDALAFLRDDVLSQLELEATSKTFLIAMSACSRDSLNQNALTHAFEMLDLMEKKLDVVDPKCLALVVELVNQSEDLNVRKAAVERLEPTVERLSSLLTIGRPGAPMGSEAEQRERAKALNVFTKMISLFDRLLRRFHDASPTKRNEPGAVTKEEAKRFGEMRTKLATYVSRAAYQDKKREGILSSDLLSSRRGTNRDDADGEWNSDKGRMHAFEKRQARKDFYTNDRESSKPLRLPKKWPFSR